MGAGASKSGAGGGGHTFRDEALRAPEASQDADWQKASPNPLSGKVAREETLKISRPSSLTKANAPGTWGRQLES